MPRRPAWILGILILGLLMGGAFLVAGRKLQEQPEFCRACHSSAYSDWRASGAATDHQSCIVCHAGAGVVEAVTSELRGGLRIARYFAGSDPRLAKAEVPNEHCSKCHSDGAALSTDHHALLPPRLAVDACRICHPASIDGSSGREHGSQGFTGTCSACHNHGAPFRGARLPSLARQDDE